MDGKRVVEWEAELSAYNRKTTDFTKFEEYIRKKNEINARLAPFYIGYIFRKLKLGSYIRRQITEARLLTRFMLMRQLSPSATSNNTNIASTRNPSREKRSGPCFARRATACILWMNYGPAAAVARVAANARRSGSARIPGRIVAAVS